MNPDSTTTPAETAASAENKVPNPPFISSLKAGNHPVVITKADIVANHNGKQCIELIGDNGTRLLTYQMFLTTPAAKQNAAKQIKRSFDIDLVQASKEGKVREAVQSIATRKANFRVELEEYKGRISPKVKFVNPDGHKELSDEDIASLSFDEVAEETTVDFN